MRSWSKFVVNQWVNQVFLLYKANDDDDDDDDDGHHNADTQTFHKPTKSNPKGP